MKKLPKKIILSDVKESVEKTFSEKQTFLQDAVAKISELRNLKFESVEQLESVSKKWLEAEINQSKQNLNTMFANTGGFIPAGISKQFSDEYERVKKECQAPINTIKGTLAWCKEKGIGLKIDSKGRPWLNEKDVKEAVEREATHTFSDGEMEYYEHFQAIFEAMDALRRFESENGYEPSDLQTVTANRFVACFRIDMETLKQHHEPFQFTPEEYYRLIAYGKICRKKHPKDD